MIKGREHPITVIYSHEDGYECFLTVKWSWAGQEKASIPEDCLRHTLQQERHWNWHSEEDYEIDPASSVTVPVKNVFVYKEQGRFAGWPAGSGIWSWGDEIVVGFELGYYKYSKYGHSRDGGRPQTSVLARSMDGGLRWTTEDPGSFVGDGGEAVPSPGGIDFAHPDFAMRCDKDEFYVSYDRGRTWQGPYKFPALAEDLTSRTDYVVSGPSDCLFFMSAKEERVEAGLRDRAFCAKTGDGGKTFEFLSWMTGEPISVRSVMSSTVRISESRLVSALRRRHDERRPNLPEIRKNWIDVYHSKDGGRTWELLSKVADTDRGEGNGNPPGMVRLNDGRLCVTYGYRSPPHGIRAKLSPDDGRTWGKEILLRTDGLNWDIGYPRMVQRKDGKLVTVYYHSTNENPEQHIAATIWDPEAVGPQR
jgi:hypothetical protein